LHSPGTLSKQLHLAHERISSNHVVPGFVDKCKLSVFFLMVYQVARFVFLF
jgi:hypothetical protein